ncbi:barstar family protein [Acidovorax sp. GBBC 3334]|uniref:barstar family protein n=1 Tax=Acidovorax sp. GBBC 3334 TaxID=2940496 RepID=UPI002302082F|nr:barstar family protein [Acidovorax sp. GBBC 3334]MDA8455068.1 barstar family protein [Acidovorax sp. GBBC 3334]
MKNIFGPICVESLAAEEIISEREKLGWKIFRLPSEISSKDDFFDGVRCLLSLDPPLRSNRSWDALADSLWAGLDNISEGNIIIVWPNVSEMKSNAPRDFDIAINILSDLSMSFLNSEVSNSPAKNILILQLNNGTR